MYHNCSSWCITQGNHDNELIGSDFSLLMFFASRPNSRWVAGSSDTRAVKRVSIANNELMVRSCFLCQLITI